MVPKPPKTDTAPDWTGPRIDFVRFSAELAARRATLGGNIPVPGNCGIGRAEGKKALLKAIEEIGRKW